LNCRVKWIHFYYKKCNKFTFSDKIYKKNCDNDLYRKITMLPAKVGRKGDLSGGVYMFCETLILKVGVYGAIPG
jgi:hypothetical protein